MGTWYVARDESALCSCSELMDLFEDSIGGFIPALPFLPPFGNSLIVNKYFDAATFWA